MTNAEKFEKVFGVKPDLEYPPFECPDTGCNSSCKYWDENWGHCGDWWNEECKATAIPELISKNAPSIVDIFSCPHMLPCGWCDKRDMLCTQKG